MNYEYLVEGGAKALWSQDVDPEDWQDRLSDTRRILAVVVPRVQAEERVSEAKRYLAIAGSQDGRTEAYEELIAALEAVAEDA